MSVSSTMLSAESALRRAIAPLVPALPLLVGLAAFARALVAPLSLLNDPDTYLHIAAGRWILAHRGLPAHDPFSHSMAGAAWVVHEWLSEVVLAALYDALGWSGLVLATAGCFALSVALLMRQLMRRMGPLLSLVVGAPSALLVLPHLLARPHILALPLLVIWSAAIIDARDRGGAPPFRVLPVMTLWANLHGGFMAGVGLAALAAAEAAFDRRAGRPAIAEAGRWGLFVLLAAVAAMLTPNGLAGFLLPFRMLQMPVLLNSFTEWMSPDFHDFQPLELWLLGLLLLGFSLGVKLPLPRLLLLLGLVHIALQQARQAEILGLIAPLAIAASLGQQLPLPRSTSPARVSSPVLGLVLAAGLALCALTLIHPVQRTDDDVTPASALAAATSMGLSGPVLNSEGFGGYLIFRGVPTFIDGRIEMYGDQFLKRYIDADRGGSEPTLTGLLRDYAITWTLLEPTSPANGIMDHLPGWRRVHTDAHAVIHARAEALPVQ